MGTGFTEGKEIKLCKLKPGMKVYLNHKWWTATSISTKGSELTLNLEAKFQGSVTLTLPNDYIVLAEQGTTMGHKGEAFWTNDSSQSAEQEKNMPAVVDTGWGDGSQNDQ